MTTDLESDEMIVARNTHTAAAAEGLGRLEGPAAEAYSTVTGALDEMAVAGRGAHDVTARLNDDLVPKDGRERLARESFDASTSKLEAAATKSLGALTVLEQRLRQQATPTAPTDPTAVAGLRDEIRLMLGDTQGATALSVVERIMGSHDDLAAVLASRWGRALLESRGIDDPGEILDHLASARAAEGTPEQRHAARALAAVVELRKAHAAAYQGARGHLTEAGQHLGATVV